MQKARITEIFRSIQGEGRYSGVPQVFVRFFECHMHCRWCDTPDAIGDGKREFKEYTAVELLKEIKPFWADCHSVSLTGGEPLLQADFIKEFIPYLKKGKRPVYLETSGVLYQALKKIVREIDFIAMDFKLPSSTRCRPFWKEHEAFLKIACRKDLFVKAVVTSDTAREDIQKAVSLLRKVDPNILFILQPNYFEMNGGAVSKCLEFQKICLKSLSDVRILPQTHKFMELK